MSLTSRFEPLQSHEEPKPVCFCYQCGEDLFHGETAYDCDDEIFCEFCGFDNLTEELEELEISYRIGDICNKCKEPFDDDGYHAFRIDEELYCEDCSKEIIIYSAEIVIDKEVMQ